MGGGSEEYRSSEPTAGPGEAVPLPQLGSDTIKCLSDIAEDAYDRQDELNESIWRSLPFFAASLALAVTLLGRAGTRVPPIEPEPFSIASNIVLGLSALSFAWAFRWLWSVLSSRDYQYPSDYQDVRGYAEQTQAYHLTTEEEATVDAKVVDDLRLFRANQLGEAAQVNLRNNAVRLKARSQLLLFMMIGFLLAIGTEVITSIQGLIAGLQS